MTPHTPHTPHATNAEALQELWAAIPIRGVLFDLDGTLADTEPAWIDAKAVVAERHGISWTQTDAARSVGQPTLVYCAEFVRRGADATIDEIADQITVEVVATLGRGIRWKPGALDVLQNAVEAGVATALVTMAYRPVALAIAQATNLPVFDVIVAGDDVQQSKPHPEPYLRALDALGLDAREAIAIEDTETGAASARAAGLTTIVIPSAGAAPAHPDPFVLDSLVHLPSFRPPQAQNR